MSALNKLRQRRGEIASEMDTILNGELTDEARSKFDALEAESKKVRDDIARAERLEEERKFLATPVTKPHKMDADDDRPGAGLRADKIEMGKDNEAAKPWGEGVRGFGEFLTAVRYAADPTTVQRGMVDKRLLADRAEQERRAASGLGESKPADGGFLVQTAHADTLLQRTIAQTSLLSRCTPFPIPAGANAIEIPAIDETTRVEGSRYGGIKFYWEDEGTSPTASKPKFSKVGLKPRKLIALVYGVDELVQDYAALGTLVSTLYSKEAAFRVDDAIINGAGAPGMLGVMAAPCLVSVAAESGQGSATILADNVINMWSRLAPEFHGESVWLIGADSQPQLHRMGLSVGSGGQVVYMPAGGLSASPYASLMGRPVLVMEQCQTVGTTGDIILGGWSAYVVGQKGAGLTMAESLHVRFANDENTWRFTWRIDGQPWWKSAVNPAHGSNTISPFVALATR